MEDRGETSFAPITVGWGCAWSVQVLTSEIALTERTLIAVCHVLAKASKMNLSKQSTPSARQSELAASIAVFGDDALGVTLEATEPVKVDQSAFDALQGDPNHMSVVRKRDGKFFAMRLLSGRSRRGAWRKEIKAVCVSCASRAKGVGQELLAWSVDIARQRGCTLVQLTSDRRRPDAPRSYQCARFARTRFGYKMSLETP